MARYKHPSRKKRLAKFRKQTRWAPFWTVPKISAKPEGFIPEGIQNLKEAGEEQRQRLK